MLPTLKQNDNLEWGFFAEKSKIFKCCFQKSIQILCYFVNMHIFSKIWMALEESTFKEKNSCPKAIGEGTVSLISFVSKDKMIALSQN